MTGYLPIDRSKVTYAVLTPMAAYFVAKELNRDVVKNMVRYLPDQGLRARVIDEIDGLFIAAKIYDNGQLEPTPTDSPSITSGESLEQWLSVSEVATMLNVNGRTVRNRIEDGTLTGRKRDKKSWEIEPASVEALRVQLKAKAA